jgi:hypothetical protein
MATFYVEGKVDLMILIDDFGNTRITKKHLSYMFGFQCGSIHASRDDAFDDNNVVKNSRYQEFVLNPNGVHWDVEVGRYRIVGNNFIQCFQSIILTLGTIASMANVAPKTFIVKQKRHTRRILQFHLRISLHQPLFILMTILMRMFASL